jgi:hypothetical protein
MAHADPFLGTEARARGVVTRRTLRSGHDQVHRDVYIPKGEKLTPVTRAVAAWLWSGRQATAAGFSASALYGTQWIDHQLPAELYRRNGKPVDGILIHRDELFGDEIRLAQGISATTPARTAFDLGRRGRRTQALIAVDALANATRLLPSDVMPLLERHRGVRGLVQLREVLDLMDNGAESPQETRTRLLLVDAGFLGRGRRSSWAVGASIWVGRNSRWVSSTTVLNTGPIPRVVLATSTNTPIWTGVVGEWCASTMSS